MHNILRKIFGSSKTLLVMTVLMTVFMLHNTVYGISSGDYLLAAFAVLYIVCTAGILIAFKNNSEPAVKYLAGMIMGMIIIGAVSDCVIDIPPSWDNGKYWCIMLIVWAVCGVAFAVLHFVAALSRNVRPNRILAAGICIVVYLAITLLLCLDGLTSGKEGILDAVYYFGCVFLTGCIVCIDTRLEVFKEN